jgi:hypothetical protein
MLSCICMCAVELCRRLSVHVCFDTYNSLGMFRHVMYVSLGMICFVYGVLFSDWYVSLVMYLSFGMFI